MAETIARWAMLTVFSCALPWKLRLEPLEAG